MSSRTQARGAWLLVLGALVALGASIFDYWWPGNGIHGAGGVVLVIVSSVLMAILGVALARWRSSSRWVHGILLVVLLIDILGTGFAAYMLEAWWVLGGSALALVGWLVDVVPGVSSGAAPAPAVVMGGLALAAAFGALSFGPALHAQDARCPHLHCPAAT